MFLRGLDVSTLFSSLLAALTAFFYFLLASAVPCFVFDIRCVLHRPARQRGPCGVRVKAKGGAACSAVFESARSRLNEGEPVLAETYPRDNVDRPALLRRKGVCMTFRRERLRIILRGRQNAFSSLAVA
jgi:hypothetical protein